MYADTTKPPAAAPTPDVKHLQPGVSLLTPLLRTGDTGPGLLVLAPDSTSQASIVEGVPSLMMKWAEEGYTVVEIQESAFSTASPDSVLGEAVDALLRCDKCLPKDKIGLVSYVPSLLAVLATSIPRFPGIVAAITYTSPSSVALPGSSLVIPLLCHLAGTTGPNPLRSPSQNTTTYHYPAHQDPSFAIPFSSPFHYITESVSHTRNLSFLKPHMGGPFFDLEAIWDEHTHYEFADRSVEHTMGTMVAEPYVNHVPTMTGGVGRASLTQFYRDNFIFANSDDSELELISRTIGVDRIVDEFIFKFTHAKMLNWLLPGVPPTHRHVQVPFTGVINIRGDRLYHEHIAWDQGAVLRQLGLLPEYLPYPYLVEGQQSSERGGEHMKKYEYRVPVAGVEVAGKMRERNSVRSNQMMGFQVREIEKDN